MAPAIFLTALKSAQTAERSPPLLRHRSASQESFDTARSLVVTALVSEELKRRQPAWAAVTQDGVFCSQAGLADEGDEPQPATGRLGTVWAQSPPARTVSWFVRAWVLEPP